MKYYILLAACCFTFISRVTGQSQVLQVSPNILLPKDSIDRTTLPASLNNFLASAQLPNEANAYVWAPEQIETFIELDEINGIEKSSKYKDDHFYKPYLSNIVHLKTGNYYIQVAYMGAADNTPMLRASFEFIAHRHNDSFQFSSMLVSNTKRWKKEKTGSLTFHYRDTINRSVARRYADLVTTFDKKLGAANKTTELYLCENSTQLQQLTGVAYKSDYNGQPGSIWVSKLGDKKLVIAGNDNAGFSHFDEHDLWHERLSMVVPRSKVNKAVDEGCAYLYGGSWGLSWKGIFKAFCEQVANNKNADWAAAKDHPIYFKTKEYNNSADYIVTALLVQKIEKTKGFAGVRELLNCGKDDYFATLEKLTGITKASYNEQVWALIRTERSKLKL